MSKEQTESIIATLRELSSTPVKGDCLITWQRSTDELQAVLLVAEVLEELWRNGTSARVFDGGLAVSIFRDQSTRTRFSYAGAASLLGLDVQELDEKKSQIGHGETVRETATMISFLTEAIGIRDDMFLGEGHKYMADVAAALDESFAEGVLPQRPAVINLQCDLDHPTQTLSDLLHLKRTFGSLEALRGKKLAMTWAYSPSYGKPLSVPQGVICLMARFGMDVVLAHPPGYDLVPETLETAATFARESGGSFKHGHDMAEAFRDADLVYPKSWAPLNVMEQRTQLLKDGDTTTFDALEQQCLAQNAKHKDWECNQKLMALTREGKALYMHCLPADITSVSCQSGEVAADVFESARLTTYRQAGHKPFIIGAMIMLSRFDNPSAVLTHLVEKDTRRRVE